MCRIVVLRQCSVCSSLPEMYLYFVNISDEKMEWFRVQFVTCGFLRSLGRKRNISSPRTCFDTETKNTCLKRLSDAPSCICMFAKFVPRASWTDPLSGSPHLTDFGTYSVNLPTYMSNKSPSDVIKWFGIDHVSHTNRHFTMPTLRIVAVTVALRRLELIILPWMDF